MKPVKHAGGPGSIGIALAFVLTAAAVLGITGQTAAQTGGKYCEIALTGCPQDYHGKDLVVPLDAVAFSAQINACGISDSLTSGGTAHAPAIVFIIDESISMGGFVNGEWWGTGNDAQDPYGNRYRVARALIDSIYSAYPSAEVGIVIFNGALVFDSRRDNNLVEFGGTTFWKYDRQSYMPLRPLNSMSVGGGSDPFYPNDTTWIGLLKNMFKDTTISISNGPQPRGTYTHIKGSVQGDGLTDISLAFEAAREALRATSRAPENQYIIFLSDGVQEVSMGDANNNNARYPLRDNFITEVQNTPTTYTVFLTRNPRTERPQALYDMTENIKNNGYSESNLESKIWVLQSNYDELLSLMMEEIVKPMLSKSESIPRKIVISSGGITDSTTDEENFTFIRQLPIDTAEVTTVEMGLRYDIYMEITETRPDGTDTTRTVLTEVDSLFMYSFTVRRSEDVPENWMESQGLGEKCAEKPSLRLMFGETNLEGLQVNNSMSVLTVELHNPGGLFNYGDFTNIPVQIMNAEGLFIDTENLSLRRINDSTYHADFVRIIANSATANDRILQHSEKDSIIVFFRNPYIPLDTLRISVPFVSTYMALYDGPGDPNTGNPRPVQWPDTITVVAGSTTDIYAKFFDPDGNYDPSFESNPNRIEWKVDSTGFGRVEDRGLNGKFYSEWASKTRTVTATFDGGALSERIVIHVIPDSAHYIHIVPDTSNITNRAVPADTMSRPYSFDNSDNRQAVFYAFVRDKYGNFIGPAVDSDWVSSDQVVSIDPISDGTSANVSREGNAGGDIMITVTKQDPETGKTITGRIRITAVGESSFATGPNPFIPGVSNVYEMLDNVTNLNRFIRDDYEHIIKSGGNEFGILIAATAPRSIKPRPGTSDVPMASVVIYDAVGNIVYRSKPGDLAMSNSTFGFVWDGRNNAGRVVGGGTYLVRITGTQTDNRKFSGQKRIGVKLQAGGKSENQQSKSRRR